MKPKVKKSSNHSKITGDFSEAVVLYWLSKYGLECAKVDHTGIDLIAKNKGIGELMGISVKSRSRSEGKESESLSIKKGDFAKAEAACRAFGCVPYFALQVDQNDAVWLFILSQEHLFRLHPKAKTTINWKMTAAAIEMYRADSEVITIRMPYEVMNWWRPQ